MDKIYGSIAIIGRPNVGKSSLFNRLCQLRIAITSKIAGTTRDIKKAHITLGEMNFLLLDTGGLDKKNDFFEHISSNSLKVAEESDLILYLLDGKEPPNEEDKKIFYHLEKKNPHIFLVINKIDNEKEEQQVWSFTEFGSKNYFFISTTHNRGITGLQNAILKHFKDQPIAPLFHNEEEESLEDFLEHSHTQESINIGIIGRVNVGKSSLLNALLGQERSLVSNIAGTTIDPVDEISTIGNTQVCFVDTAGIRRRGQIGKGEIGDLERFALLRTKEVLSKTDIALLVLDASKPFVELDEKIAGLIDEYKLATIVVFNKWDIAYKDFKAIMQDFKLRFRFLEYAPTLTISAKNGRHIQKLEEEILKVYKNFSFRIPTSKLNDILQQATIKHPIPSDKGKIVKIYYATQFDNKPPQIALIMNRPKSLHFSYKRYLANFLREHFDFSGTKIIFIARGKNDFQESDQ